MEEKKVSIIIPVLNEEKHIEKCIDSLINNDYENKEIIVVDGMSEDRTRDILRKYENIRIIDNPDKTTPIALNIGLKNATGDYIMIAGAHTTYSKNYISACVRRLDEDKCDVAGGKMVTIQGKDTPVAKAISIVLSHPFGIGGAKYRLESDKEEYVDTVAYGVYKREVFEKLGGFVEKLRRNQDIEMNLRIKNAGFRIMLVPEAEAYYYARDNFKDLWKNNFNNGLWVILSTHYARKAFSLRHLVPLFFVLFLVLGGVFSIFYPIVRIPYFSILGLYLILSLYFSFDISRKNKDFKLFFPTLFSFWTLHVSYGLGSLYGLFIIL
ncbi:glycosyl transferase [Marinitoga piezophila KA3]|uniref:Glycosyl transferase n=1 Tax=Marinitoga piezophila (strain DSM 14283 / JCM 11233 / KA3) TaxID=443254 RepID=H2J2X5_MARPK|nr:glycosyltransferase family 2 protein [Marinitoga piezophila]AEX85666.1 glycosyl transferase [Marinitoga piezophila KA3]